MQGAARSSKRPRDELPPESPEAKRFRGAGTVLEILDSDDEADSGGDRDLAGVIKSLEEEIAAAPGPPLMDLGYLLEASDDELGLPPAPGSSPSMPSDCGDVVEIVDAEAEAEVEAAGFDRIWGYEDEMSIAPYEGLEFGFLTEFDDGSVIFDGGLFDYTYSGCGLLDHEDLTWRTESLPAN